MAMSVNDKAAITLFQKRSKGVAVLAVLGVPPLTWADHERFDNSPKAHLQNFKYVKLQLYDL